MDNKNTMTAEAANAPEERPADFVREIVAADIAAGKYKKITTRFPPEPNGYLHIGHAKSICLNFGIAREFHGVCNLRMDDTNPTKEDVEYVESIIRDVRWLIAGWADDRLGLKRVGQTPASVQSNGRSDFYIEPVVGCWPADASVEPFYASDYFDQLYYYAVELIKKGKAYVCDLSPEETEAYRGAPDRPGRESPYRNRSVAENLDLFERMKAGEFPDGTRTLRAKIDMSSPNIWMRDPVLYRIRHAEHHHTGNKWCIYPMYDFAHCLSDYLEGITHSICTLEFEVHRPLYDWILESLELPRPLPHQYEFARLNLAYTIMSKRKLLQLVQEGRVSGWDDPRMPTLAGLRRRGVTPEAIRRFCYRIGVTKYDGLTDMALFEHSVREDLNQRALRRLAVLRPLRMVITNYPEGKVEEVQAVNNPEDLSAGTRPVPFSRVLWIEHDDFMENPPANYYRLRPGGEVRLKYAYIVRCDEVVKNAEGQVVELRCTADLDSKSGGPTANRKVKGTIHWVSASHAIQAEVRLYDRLFSVPEPDLAGGKLTDHLNPRSLEIVSAMLEPSLRDAKPEERYQFERLGYFCVDVPDPIASANETRPPDRLVFNRTITLRDSWAKESRKPPAQRR
jgi:glutaminyl-tRNA synthetase